MANSNLVEAQKAKNDEFYTQYADIEKEISAYLEYNPDVFRDKTLLLPCDDPEWSNFTKYFAQNFERFGLKKLISTSYAVESKKYKNGYQPTLFETRDPQFDKIKTTKNGKIFTLSHDKTGDHKVNVDDLEWHYLTGDGDFRSDEIKKLRDESDIIITNPPFSLFREFLAWIVKAKKQLLIIGNMNAITYKEVFPFIKDNKLWLGATNFNTGMYFQVPKDFVYANTYKFEREQNGVKVNRVPGVCWFTNLEHGRRHQPLPLMTMADNLKFSKHKEIKGKKSYDVYDNYDAIEIPFTDSIPSDYDGAMGVPISFLDKYSPEQFEILGITDRDNNSGLKTREYTEEDVPNSGDLNRRGVIKIGNEYKSTYARLLIRKKPKK
ncbi:MAG: DNA methyltransferase [Anaerolineales bacterium]|nr:DNA methyltransferase [Anaerolineales bacterium]MCL4259432.1 adenosine deaminase [Anaerolineales bacterium]